MTGIPARAPVADMRLFATAPYMRPSGLSMPAVKPALRHQNAGSRMMDPLAQLELHQIGIERCQSAVQRTTQVPHHNAGRLGHARTSIRVGQPGGEMGSQAIDAFDRFCAARTVERGVDLAE